jgi:hypothetical protein
MKTPLEWLLESNQPGIRYRTLVDILDRPSSDEKVRRTLAQVAQRGWAAEILREQLPGFRVGGIWQYQGYWHNYVLLNQPKYIATVWKFLVLKDLGLTAKNSQVMKTCKLLSDLYLKNRESYHLCMTANICRAFLQAGFDEKSRVRSALDWLVDVQKEDGGWHCFESSRGTLDCWEPLSAFAALPKNQWNRRIKESIERGAEFYLKRRLFREGVRVYPPWFRFHYPVHYYYDLLVGLEVISSLGYGKDPRMKFALELLQKKKRADGRWILDAVNPDIPKNLPKTSYSSSPPFEPFPAIPFALERVGKPSKCITLRALRVLKNVEDVA